MKKRICEICKKEIPPMVVFNSDPLTIAEYFTTREFRESEGKEDKWCLICAEKVRTGELSQRRKT